MPKDPFEKPGQGAEPDGEYFSDVADDELAWLRPLSSASFQDAGLDNDIPEMFRPGFVDEDERPRLTRKQRFMRRVVAPLVTVATLGTGTAIALEQQGSHNHPAGQSSEPTAERPTIPGLQLDYSTGDPRVDSDLRHAVTLSGCDTQVEFKDVATTYTRIFGGEDLTHAPVEKFRSLTDDILKSIKQTRENLSFATLPADFDQLLRDAYGQQKRPLSEYKTALQDFVGQLGMKAIFHWEPKNQTELTGVIEPVSAEQLTTSQETRLSMVTIIDNFRSIPSSLIQNAGVKNIVFGNINKQGTLGEAPFHTRDILFDVHDFNKPDNSLWSNLSLINVAPAHELMHQLDYSLCFRHTKGAMTDWPYIALSRGFPYGKKTQKILQEKGKKGQFTTLESQMGGQAVVVRPYGAVNEFEDKATLIGENVLDSPNAASLFVDNKADMKILEEKAALEAARIEKQNPAAAEFIIQDLRAARLSQYMYDRLAKINGHLGINPTAKQRTVAQRKDAPYLLMTREMINAVRGDYHRPEDLVKGGAAD